MDEDLKMLEELSPKFGGVKYNYPPATQCPDCRLRRKMAQVNQMNLYETTCAMSGERMLSNVRPDAPFTVIKQELWHSDAWDPLATGQDYDFNRPFFEQWYEVMLATPRPSLFTGFEFDENCDYTNHAGKNKNCYLIFDSDEDWDCYYSYSINQCKNCLDCFRTRKSELCYECVDCVSCYSSAYVQDSDNCSDSMFLKNCTGCKNCLMCSNLKNKEYHVENKPVSKEEFEKFRAMLGSHKAILQAKKRFNALKIEFPQKYMHGLQNEDVLGDYLVNCKSAYQCFDSEDVWDCRYAYQVFMPMKTSMDIHECGEGERLYECSVLGYQVFDCSFSHHMLSSVNNLYYCSICHHSKNCFGCCGARRQEYCILNKQYTKEGYEEIMPRIIEHMKSTGEWGEFFSPQYSTYGYNESLAQDYYPMTRDDVLANGWKWTDGLEKEHQAVGTPIAVPDSIGEVGDNITEQKLTCETSGKQYKIIPQEIAFYKQLNLPIPRKCFMQRHKERQELRNKRKLYDRSCDRCGVDITTTYEPERPEKIYCETCYLQDVY
ncbi:MAG: hypothetical protein O2904_03565 [bacterium]|nr:hypothetical protein [bacterium]